MRRNSAIEAVWNSGKAIGLGRANARVTVNRSWQLDEFSQATRYTRWGLRNPVRGYANGTEVDIPIQNIKTISIDRSIDADTATLNLTLLNAHPTDGPAIRKQGMFSPRRTLDGSPPVQAPPEWPVMTGDRGDPSSDAYWGDARGELAFSYGALAAGNMIQTYQGYGANLVRTGVWIIDTASPSSKGELVVVARCVGALLVDQPLYARGKTVDGGGIVPNFSYPMQFFSELYNKEVYGSPAGSPPHSTNYTDLVEVVQIIAAWAGFADGGGLLGQYEETGIALTSPFTADAFDKKFAIDAIKMVRDIVGYTTMIDQDGGFHFTKGNQWESGNFIDGVHTDDVFDISERQQLIEYTGTNSKKADRSAFIVTEADPYYRGGAGEPYPEYASYRTNTSNVNNQLHQMRLPAMIPVDHRVTFKEMVTMAELTGLRSWFQRRHGTCTIMGTPLIDVGDQVRILERTTYDHFLHHVDSLTSNHDVQSGVWTMTLNTHWMGPSQQFKIYVGPSGNVIYNGSSAGRDPNEDAVNGYSLPYVLS